MNLFQHLVDVDGVALLARLSPLLGFPPGRLGLGRCLLLPLLRGYFARHSSFSVAKLKLRGNPVTRSDELAAGVRFLLCELEDHFQRIA